MRNKCKLILSVVAIVGSVVSYKVWETHAHPMRIEARHYASSFSEETDEVGRCASADLAAAYYRKDGDQEKFEEWKIKADSHCPQRFPQAYFLAKPA